MSSEIPKNTFQLLSFQKNYFLQCNATAADSSQSNVSRVYFLKKQTKKPTQSTKFEKWSAIHQSTKLILTHEKTKALFSNNQLHFEKNNQLASI